MKTSIVRWSLLALVLVMLTLAIGRPTYADDPTPTPIPIPTQEDARPVPEFIGHEATPQPIAAPAIPQNPFMAPGSWSSFHNDTYMSDTYFTSGPLGHSPSVWSSFLGESEENPTATSFFMTFDREGLLVTAVMKTNPAVMQRWVQLTLIDPDTLGKLATFDLPPTSYTSMFELGAGAYMYTDNQDRVVAGTQERTIIVVSHTTTAPFAFTLERTYDLRGVIPAGDGIQAFQPDFTGHLWFASKAGLVGTLDMQTGDVIGAVALGEKTENGTAIDETGAVYLNTSRAMYRFDPDKNGAPSITWREPYDWGHVKVISEGSGSTPTLMGKDYVAIADNADPQVHVLVYRRAKDVEGPRLICAEPVFQPGQSMTENSVIATDRSIVVENNFGYRGPKSVEHGSTTEPGITRIDLDADGHGCHTVWTNMEVSSPWATAKLSLANGLIYAYTKPKGPVNTDAWYLAAIDFETGETVYKVLTGTGWLYNAAMGVVYLSPDGAVYVGLMAGVVKIEDGR